MKSKPSGDVSSPNVNAQKQIESALNSALVHFVASASTAVDKAGPYKLCPLYKNVTNGDGQGLYLSAFYPVEIDITECSLNSFSFFTQAGDGKLQVLV